ncbi:hypothetical protein GCM10022395_05750 [Snuella lapsa]|uniref:Uncharacterized protein n=1 Tax=Snuella lapsa TaxID=870481 RepID=A0ABP6X181_9FLAO
MLTHNFKPLSKRMSKWILLFTDLRFKRLNTCNKHEGIRFDLINKDVKCICFIFKVLNTAKKAATIE